VRLNFRRTAAQTKISGTNHCAKADPQAMVQVGDRPNHAFSVGQIKCAWTKPWELAGIPGNEGVGAFSGEIDGNKSRFHAYYVDTMENGDKAYYCYQGTAVERWCAAKERRHLELDSRHRKLKGVTGKGTYEGTAGADGTMTYEVQGEYQTSPKKS
jgi:hypothetical protein